MPSATDCEQASPPDLSQKLPKLVPRQRTRSLQPSPNSTPNPVTPPLPAPPAFSTLHCSHPVRRVLSPHDHELFLKSSTYTLIVSFVFTISDSVCGTTVSEVTGDEDTLHPSIQSLLSILRVAEDVVKECPPEDTGSRFGNPAFRTYISTMSTRVEDIHKTHFPDLSVDALDELTTYLLSSLGSPLRIDYGSGHELHFIIYLLCLYRLSLLPAPTFPALALLVFPQYLDLMRILQGSYYLEPAGSHGVWGLDDYHFLPFLFGASQLCGHSFLRPIAIHSASALDAYAKDFLYLDMVKQVNATKTVEGLRWHSPMLDDISGVKGGWEKVYGGLKKMFLGEVLGKLVVMQHFLFGGIVPATDGMSDEDVNEETLKPHQDCEEVKEAMTACGDSPDPHPGHAHNQNSWGDCCGIKVPSSIGATQEMKKRTGNQGLRRLPFD